MAVDFSGAVAWLLVALPASMFVTTLMPGRGYGLIADLLIGVIGGAVGAMAVSSSGIQGQAAWIAGLLVTIVGALVLTRFARAWPGRSAV